jgi:hypothetical protein
VVAGIIDSKVQGKRREVKDRGEIIQRKESGERMHIGQNEKDQNKRDFSIRLISLFKIPIVTKAYVILSNKLRQCEMTCGFWFEIY